VDAVSIKVVSVVDADAAVDDAVPRSKTGLVDEAVTSGVVVDMLVDSVDVAVVVVSVVVPTASVDEAVTVTVTGSVDVAIVITGTGGGTMGNGTNGVVEVATLGVDVAVVVMTSVVGKVVAGVVVATTVSVAAVFGTAFIGAGVTGTGPPVRCLLNQYATAATPSDQEAYVWVDVPVFPTFPGLNVCAPTPAVPKRESNSMIAQVRRVSTAYFVVASTTI